MNPIDDEIIVTKFYNVKTVRQLAVLLNYIENINEVNITSTKKISTRDLTYLAISKNRRYVESSIPKKNGTNRKISAPDSYLKRIQFVLNKLLSLVFESHVHHNANGFIKGRDIVRNAKPHVNKRFVLNMDIKDFFPSVEFRRVKSVLELNPFKLSEERENLAFIIANIVTYKNTLPQGAPTSPIISNIVCQRLDRKLTRYCKSKQVRYSRYADDLTFSTNKNILKQDFIEEIERIVKEENFIIKPQKTRLRSNMDRQLVTGLVVNEKVNVKKEYLNTVRAMLNNWEKGGTIYAQSQFELHKKKIEQNIDFRNSLGGHIDFLGLVKGHDSSIFKMLKQKFEFLNNRCNYEMIENLEVRKQLIKDNKKMELILFDKVHAEEDNFISFCTSAFHQIENLLNYYYWKRFPEIDDLKLFMLDNNPAFEYRWKSIERLRWVKKVRDFDINLLVYLFEKEYYFDKKKYYNQEITILREIRNDESHRCSIFHIDKQQVSANFELIKEKWNRFEEKHKKKPLKQKEELKIESQIKLFGFLEKKDYKQVRSILMNVINKTTGTYM